jgi:hypothetical protein
MADYDGLDDDNFSGEEDAADFYPEDDDNDDEIGAAVMGGDRGDIGDDLQAAGDDPADDAGEDEGDEEEEEQVRVAYVLSLSRPPLDRRSSTWSLLSPP